VRILLVSLLVACAHHPAPDSPDPVPTVKDAPVPVAKDAPAPAGEPDALRGITDAHNRDRAAHCAPPLAWSPEVAKVAQRWADHLKDAGCELQHSGGTLGENLAAGTAGTLTAVDVVAMWFDERKAYDFAHPGFGMRTGHFTQVVWKGSQRLGCGTATCGDMQVWVCNYDPPGNMEEDFADNVKPATCK
jgi:uncharacterized protein YkwD